MSGDGRGRLIGTCLALASWVVLACWAGTAQAAVAHRGSTSAAASTPGSATNGLSLTMARPSGLAVDDVMIASAQWVVKTANGSTIGATGPAGWTRVDDNNTAAFAVQVWWKRATAADVAAATFTFSAAWTNRQAVAAGVVSAFSGVVRTGDPLSWGAVTRTGFGGYPSYAGSAIENQGYGYARPGATTFGAPAYTPVPGSLGLVAAMVTGSGDTAPVDLVSTENGTVAGVQPASGGGGADGINTAVTFAVPDASGAYADPYIKSTFSRSVDRTALSMVLTPTPCGAGGLDLSAPGPVTFPTTALNGTDRLLSATSALFVDDQSENGVTSAGWKVTLNPTRFTNGTDQLPATALSVLAASHADPGGRCAAPVNAVTYSPLTVPSGTATKVFSAAADSGRGPTMMTLQFRLAVPASARLGTYSSAWTYTLTAGP